MCTQIVTRPAARLAQQGIGQTWPNPAARRQQLCAACGPNAAKWCARASSKWSFLGRWPAATRGRSSFIGESLGHQPGRDSMAAAGIRDPGVAHSFATAPSGPAAIRRRGSRDSRLEETCRAGGQATAMPIAVQAFAALECSASSALVVTGRRDTSAARMRVGSYCRPSLFFAASR